MPKTKKNTKINPKHSSTELDTVFILKLTLYLILGSTWVNFVVNSGQNNISLPIGAIIGITIAMHDRFKIDRKIEYAVLLVAMFAGYWLSPGLTIIL